MPHQREATKPERTVEIARPARSGRCGLGAERRRLVVEAAQRWAAGALVREAIHRATAQALLRDLD